MKKCYRCGKIEEKIKDLCARCDGQLPYEIAVDKAISLAVEYGGIDGDHHKKWVIDQMIRVLTFCPTIKITKNDCNGCPYTYDTLGESKEYKTVIKNACFGEEGPNTYSWDIGIPP